MVRTNAFRLFTIIAICLNALCSASEPVPLAQRLRDGLGAPQLILTASEFQTVTELVSSDSIGSITQAFTFGRDSMLATIGGQSFTIYWNFQTNERFEIRQAVIGNHLESVCARQVLDMTSQTSVIADNTLFLKPSILFGYNERNQLRPVELSYGGTGRSRGLQVDKFVTTFSVPDIRATASVTYYILNETLYPGVTINNQPPIIQMDVNIADDRGLKRETYTYNVFSLNPAPPRPLLRQSLETPEGAYCPGRISTMRLPENLPDRVTSHSEGYIPEARGIVISTQGYYDIELGLTRFVLRLPSPNDTLPTQHISILHDFSDGLSYAYDYESRQCVVTPIALNSTDAAIVDGQPNFLQIQTPRHFFQFDDANYQYTGQKPCRDRFMCNVWIGEKVLPNNQFERREWYWAYSINGEPLRRWFPMRYVIKSYTGGNRTSTYDAVFFDYQSRSLAGLFGADYNLGECYRALGPANNFNLAVMSFRLDNSKGYNVMRNMNYFRFRIAETLIFALFIRPTRLSGLTIDKENSDIVVTFTLLDAPPFRGPVETFRNESTLHDLAQRFKRELDGNRLVFPTRADDQEIVLRPIPNSLNVRTRYTNTTVTQTVVEVRNSPTGPRITAFWIVFIIVGLLIGIIGGLLVLMKLRGS